MSARKRDHAPASSRNASSLWADKAKTRLMSRGSSPPGRLGASSTITCALVPPTPNELTAGATRHFASRPGRERVGIARRVPSSEMCGLSRLEVHLRRHRLVAQREHRLDQPGDARRGFEMPDVGLDRAEQASPGAGCGASDRRSERFDLDRIAQRRAGAVRLDEADATGLELSTGQRLADQRLLRRARWARRAASSGRPG